MLLVAVVASVVLDMGEEDDPYGEETMPGVLFLVLPSRSLFNMTYALFIAVETSALSMAACSF